MLDKLQAIEDRYAELTRLLEENADDYQKVAELSKERSDLETLVQKSRAYRQVMASIEEARELQNSEDQELRELAHMDLEDLLPKSEKMEKELKSMLIPRDPRDERNVIMEIRAGTGGDEAGLFAADLYRMYS